MWPIPIWVTEALTGWLALMLPWVILTCSRYLRRRRREFDSFSAFYRSSKMAISLLFLLVGLESRTVIVWALRHAEQHPESAVLHALATAQKQITLAYVASTTLMVIGAICWARTAADMPILRLQIWALAGGSLVAALWLALVSPW